MIFVGWRHREFSERSRNHMPAEMVLLRGLLVLLFLFGWGDVIAQHGLQWTNGKRGTLLATGCDRDGTDGHFHQLLKWFATRESRHPTSVVVLLCWRTFLLTSCLAPLYQTSSPPPRTDSLRGLPIDPVFPDRTLLLATVLNRPSLFPTRFHFGQRRARFVDASRRVRPTFFSVCCKTGRCTR